MKRISSTPKKKKKKQKLQEDEDKRIVIINNVQMPTPPESDLRTLNLYGDINEKLGADVISGLLYLESTSHIQIDPEEVEELEHPAIVARSISMMVSRCSKCPPVEPFSILYLRRRFLFRQPVVVAEPAAYAKWMSTTVVGLFCPQKRPMSAAVKNARAADCLARSR